MKAALNAAEWSRVLGYVRTRTRRELLYDNDRPNHQALAKRLALAAKGLQAHTYTRAHPLTPQLVAEILRHAKPDEEPPCQENAE